MLRLPRTAIKTHIENDLLCVSLRIQIVATPLPIDSELVTIIKPTWNDGNYGTTLVLDEKRKKHVCSKEKIYIPAPTSGIPPNAQIDIYSNGVLVATTDMCLTDDEEIWRQNAPETTTSRLVREKGVKYIIFNDIVWKCPKNFQPTNNTHITIASPNSTVESLTKVTLKDGILIPTSILALEYRKPKLRKYTLSIYEGDIQLASVPIITTILSDNTRISTTSSVSTTPSVSETITPTSITIQPLQKKRKTSQPIVFGIPKELEYVTNDNKTYLCPYKLSCPEGYVSHSTRLVMRCCWNNQTIRFHLESKDGWYMFPPIKLDIDTSNQRLAAQVSIENGDDDYNKVYECTVTLYNSTNNYPKVITRLLDALDELSNMYGRYAHLEA